VTFPFLVLIMELVVGIWLPPFGKIIV